MSCRRSSAGSPEHEITNKLPARQAPAPLSMTKTMTKSELIARLAERNPRLVARDADEAVNTMLDTMTEALSTGQRIEIRGFGSFALNYRPPRVGRNPKSGDRVQVPAKHVPHFKAGKELRERVDGHDATGFTSNGELDE